MGHIYPRSSSDLRTLKTAALNSPPLKIKALVDAYLVPHVCHVLRALAHAKVMIMELLVQDCNRNNDGGSSSKSSSTCRKLAKLKKKRRSKKKRSVFEFLKLHFNWSSSSSHVIPAPEYEQGFDVCRMYYDATWDSMISTEAAVVNEVDDMEQPRALSGYLHWLDQEKINAADAMPHGNGDDDDDEDDGIRGCEIDRLAEKFIASCHEKFRLEKQESYRRYQEMLARSL